MLLQLIMRLRGSDLKLRSGSRVAVIGGGPAGAFFSYFLLAMAERVGVEVQVDILEARDFSLAGPMGCNMCGGIISESLVQMLATEGINLPPQVVQRGIDSYVLHTDEAAVRIETPRHEKRIAVVHRGTGPRGLVEPKWRSFDGFLLEHAVAKGARVVRGKVDEVAWEQGRPQIAIRGSSRQSYDLLAVAVGVNSNTLKLFEALGLDYKPPRTTKTYIAEYFLGQEMVNRYLGSSMHVFLLPIPRLEFAALIPKGDYVTVCLLGKEIDAQLVQSFLNTSAVRQCFPSNWQAPKNFCHCSPRISIQGAVQPFADRVVFVGDCGATKLYKDGIGAAYRTAKAAAVTAVFTGISAEDFRRRYRPVCRRINTDNTIGKMIFITTRQIQKSQNTRQGVLRMAAREQQSDDHSRRMSMVLWDLFTGSAPYREVFWRTFHPRFWYRLLWEIIGASWHLLMNRLMPIHRKIPV